MIAHLYDVFILNLLNNPVVNPITERLPESWQLVIEDYWHYCYANALYYHLNQTQIAAHDEPVEPVEWRYTGVYK